MKQTFDKNINGHSLQFNRLLYPVRYQVKIEDPEENGMLIDIVKDEEDRWQIQQVPNIQSWFFDAFAQIQDAIKENEK